MSVKVNLLPSRVKAKDRRNRQIGLVGLGFVVLIAALAAVWFWQGTRIDDAEETLAAEEATLTELQAEQASLAEFGQLAQRQQTTETVLQVVLGDDATLAGVLQDLAAVLPTDVELTDLTMAVQPEQEPDDGARPAAGTLTLSGRTLDGHAPGLERVLVELDKAASFSDVFFSNSTLDVQEGVTEDVVSFSIEVDLGREVLTGRYRDGLPEALR